MEHARERWMLDSEEIEKQYNMLQARREEIDRIQIQMIKLQQKRIEDLVNTLDRLTEGREELGEETEEDILEGIHLAQQREIAKSIEQYALRPAPPPCIVDDYPLPTSTCGTPFVETQRREKIARTSWISWWNSNVWRLERESPTRETICTAIAMVFVAVNTSNSAPNPMTTTFLMNNILWALVLRYMLRKLFYAIRL